MNVLDLPIVDAHQHLVFPRSGDPKDTVNLDVDAMLDSGDIEAMWVLSVGDGTVHSLGDHDEAVLQTAAKYPGRIIPFGFLDFRQPPSLVDDLKKRGFPALKAHFPVKPYDHPDYMPYYERAEALGMPIVFHTGGGHAGDSVKRGFAAWTYPEGMLLANSAVSTLDLIAKRFENLVMVAAHMGGPSGFADCLHMVRANRNLYFDISCSPLSRQWQDRTREVIECCGANKMLIGSDTPYPHALVNDRFWKYFLLTRAWLSMAEREAILAGNAKGIVAATGYDARNIRLTTTP